MRDDSGSTLAERLNVIFIDLVSIRQKYGTPVKELTPIEKWGLFFSYIDKKNKADYVNNIVRSEKGLMAAETIVRYMSKADANWFTQNSIWIAERDAYSAREAQLDRVREESLEKGRNEKAVESAKEFLKEGISPEIIAKCVKLPLEEVLKLQK